MIIGRPLRIFENEDIKKTFDVQEKDSDDFDDFSATNKDHPYSIE